MAHNAVHREITRLDTLRHELDGEPVLKNASAIIQAALDGDEPLVAELIFEQIVPFNNAQDPKRVKGANIGVDLGEALIGEM